MSVKYIFKYKGAQRRIHVSSDKLLNYEQAIREIEKVEDHPLIWLENFELTASHKRSPFRAIDREEELKPGAYTLFDPKCELKVTIIIFTITSTIIVQIREVI